MIDFKICVGSSCYLKGADKVISHLQKIVSELNIKSEVELSGAFCLGNCGDGIALSVNNEIIHISTPEEAEKILRNLVGKN